MMKKPIAIVLGVGASDGLGAALARRFASGGMEVVISGRTEERIAKIAEEIGASGGKAHFHAADTTDAGSVRSLFEMASGKGGIGAVLYNVGNNMPLPFADLTQEMFEDFWRVCCFGGFITAKAALPFLEDGGGSLFFTGASASMRGRAMFAHFGSAKAALRTLAQALAKEYGPRGVHVGHVVVDGAIDGSRVREHFAEYLEGLGEDGSLKPDHIAEAFWMMHNQHRSVWTFELDVRPFKESW